jgi:hypothetical protein
VKKQRTKEFKRASSSLCSASGVKRYSGLLELLRNQRYLLVNLISNPEKQSKYSISIEALLNGFWGSFDIVLTEELHGRKVDTKSDLLSLLTSANDCIATKNMRLVLNQVHNSKLMWQEVIDLIESNGFDDRERNIIFRSLTLHLTNGSIRSKAVNSINLSSALRLLSLSSYPLSSSELILDRYIQDTTMEKSTFGILDTQKILFDLVHDTILGKLLASPSRSDLAYINSFLKVFSKSEIMKESRYHRSYLKLLNDFLRISPLELISENEIDVLLKTLSELTNSKELTSDESFSLSSFSSIPEETLSRLIVKPRYFYGIITHENPKIALLAKDFIDRESVLLPFLHYRNANGELFKEVAKERISLITTIPRAVRAFVYNPNAKLTLSSVTPLVLKKMTTKTERLQMYREREISRDIKKKSIEIHKDQTWMSKELLKSIGFP